MGDNKKALSSKKKKILKRLLAERRSLRRFNGRTYEQIKEMEELRSDEWASYDIHGGDYFAFMLKASGLVSMSIHE
jgi:hypothetical protein